MLLRSSMARTAGVSVTGESLPSSQIALSILNDVLLLDLEFWKMGVTGERGDPGMYLVFIFVICFYEFYQIKDIFFYKICDSTIVHYWTCGLDVYAILE